MVDFVNIGLFVLSLIIFVGIVFIVDHFLEKRRQRLNMANSQEKNPEQLKKESESFAKDEKRLKGIEMDED
jgi:hypothetical protein